MRWGQEWAPESGLVMAKVLEVALVPVLEMAKEEESAPQSAQEWVKMWAQAMAARSEPVTVLELGQMMELVMVEVLELTLALDLVMVWGRVKEQVMEGVTVTESGQE